MKILIKGAVGGGWSEYTINGTKTKPRNKELVEVLEGNPKLGDLITNQGNWRENEYQIVLAFRGKPHRDVVRKATQKFEKYFTAGFDKDEYHFDAVAHFDTDDTHVHIRIPKMNLVTGTQLQLYYHKKDVARVNLIRDQINFEFDLDVSVDEKPLIRESRQIEQIQKWRAENNQEPFIFDTKKNRDKAKLIIANQIKKEHESGGIDSIEELRLFFAERYPQYKIKGEGYDIPKGFHYFSILNAKEEVLRLDGEFYSEAFWQKTREMRLEQFDNNTQEPKPPQTKTDVAAKLDLATKKRVEEIEEKYRKARSKVAQELGRERARQEKFNQNKEAEERKYDIIGREDQTVGIGIGTGERAERRRESGVQERVAELVANSFSSDRRASENGDSYRSVEDNRGRAGGYFHEMEKLDSEVTERISVERELEEFGENFESIVEDKIREFRSGLNQWASGFIEGSGRKINEKMGRIGEQIERMGDKVREWLDNAKVRAVRARNEAKRDAVKIAKNDGLAQGFPLYQNSCLVVKKTWELFYQVIIKKIFERMKPSIRKLHFYV